MVGGLDREELVRRASGERRRSTRGELLDEVDLSRPQGDHLRRRALVHRHADGVERRLSAPVRVVAHERRAAPVLVALESIGAGPGHLRRHPGTDLVVPREDRAPVRRLPDEVREEPVGGLELEAHGVGADGFDARRREDTLQRRLRRGVLGCERLPGCDDVLRRQLLAGVEGDAPANLERPDGGGVARLPARREPGPELALRVRVREVLADDADQPDAADRVELARLDVHARAGDRDPQRSAGLEHGRCGVRDLRFSHVAEQRADRSAPRPNAAARRRKACLSSSPPTSSSIRVFSIGPASSRRNDSTVLLVSRSIAQRQCLRVARTVKERGPSLT